MTYFAINKFGKSMNVYSDTGHKNKIGTIGNREAFVVMGAEGEPYISFRGPNLKLKE